MADRVDAAIAALKVVLKEAEKSADPWWKARRANCWIDQLPGSWWGRWRHLRLRGDLSGELPRRLFVSDLRAVLTYLEVHRDAIKLARAWPWSYSGRAGPAQKPVHRPGDAEFSEIREAKSKTGRNVREPMRLVQK
jgi:hypothetical protein